MYDHFRLFGRSNLYMREAFSQKTRHILDASLVSEIIVQSELTSSIK